MSQIIEALEREGLKTEVPDFGPGDTVRVTIKVIEGGKERSQAFEGIVLGRKGAGVRSTFIVRKISHGVGVERTFVLHSPRVEKIEVLRQGRVRRAKLYYLRKKVGKGARVKEARYTPQSQ